MEIYIQASSKHALTYLGCGSTFGIVPVDKNAAKCTMHTTAIFLVHTNFIPTFIMFIDYNMYFLRDKVQENLKEKLSDPRVV